MFACKCNMSYYNSDMPSEEAKRRLVSRSKSRSKKQQPKMSVHGRGMKRFASPKKED